MNKRWALGFRIKIRLRLFIKSKETRQSNLSWDSTAYTQTFFQRFFQKWSARNDTPQSMDPFTAVKSPR